MLVPHNNSKIKFKFKIFEKIITFKIKIDSCKVPTGTGYSSVLDARYYFLGNQYRYAVHPSPAPLPHV